MAITLSSRISAERSKAEQYRLMLTKLSPKGIVNNYIFRSDKLRDSLEYCMKTALENSKHRLALTATAVEQLSPVKSLARGFSYTTDGNGRNISSIEGLFAGQDINVRVKDGTIKAEVISTDAG